MSGSAASNSTPIINNSLTLHVVDAQTNAENGRKFTKYKVSVNYNGREWEIWRRYKEFNTLNEKVRDKQGCFFKDINLIMLFICIFSFDVFAQI